MRTPLMPLARVTAAVACSLIATLVTPAQVYIPANNPSSGSCNAIPMSPVQTRCQLILNASYLPTQPSRITGFALAPCSSSLVQFQQLQIRVAHTSLPDFRNGRTNFVQNIGSCPVVIHDGPLQWSATANTWSTFPTTGSFAHDGRRNLIVEIRYFGATGGVSCYRDTVVPRLYAQGSGQYLATLGTTDGGTTNGGPRLCLSTTTVFVLQAPDTARLGQPAALTATGLPNGQAVQFAASLAQGPVLNFGRCKLRLAADPLFWFSIQGSPSIFGGYAAPVSALGQATATLTPPRFTPLIGTCVYHSAVAYGAGGIMGCTNTAGTQLVP